LTYAWSKDTEEDKKRNILDNIENRIVSVIINTNDYNRFANILLKKLPGNDNINKRGSIRQLVIDLSEEN
jgi:hypothetical protein